MGRSHRVIRWATALMVVGLIGAACSNNEPDTTGATTAATTGATTPATTAATSGATSGATSAATTAPSTPTQGVTDTSIKVGGVTTINGQGFTYVDWCNGAEVVFDAVNDQGGVNGRTFDFIGCKDDQVTPDKNSALTRELIEQDKVFAIVPGSELMTGADVAIAANVPFFSWGISPYYCDNDQGFGYNGCTGPSNPDYNFANWAQLIKAEIPDAKTVGAISLDIPPGKVNRAAINRGNKEAGLEVVYDDGSLPLTGTTNWTPYVQDIIKANPDALECQMAFCVPLYAALKAAGYKGLLLDAVSYNPALLSNPATKGALDGVYVLVGQSPWEETDNPAVAEAIANVKKYGKPDQVLTGELMQGYTTASMFVDMVEKAGPDLTYDSFYAVANGDDYCFDGNGLEGTTCYPKGHTDSNGCLAVVQAQGDAFVPKYPADTCFPRPGQQASSNTDQ